jgi:O-antigen/teichoic acid export membrane protein
MRVQDYVGKITWTVADKILFLLYGFVALLQIRVLPPAEVGLYSLLMGLQTWIFIISDGAALQGIIQFGMSKESRAGIHTIALGAYAAIVLGSSTLIAFFAQPLSTAFHEPRIVEVAYRLPFFCALTIPRTFCLKVLLRDSQMKQVFWVNFAWFGTMSALTLFMIRSHTLTSFFDAVFIASTGIGVSSCVAVVLTRKLIPLTLHNLPSFRSFVQFGAIQVSIAAVTNAVKQLDILALQFFFHDLVFLGMYYSAKTLYRVFETGFDALFSIVYPAAIRLLSQSKTQEFIVTLTKGASYLLLGYGAGILVLEVGGSTLLVSLLGQKYAAVAGVLNILAPAALFLPFHTLYSILLAENRNTLMLKLVTVSALCGAAFFTAAGLLGMQWIFPAGTLVYNVVLAGLLYGSVRATHSLSLSQFLRAVPDTQRFISERFLRR